MTPDPEYEKAFTAKYSTGLKRDIFSRAKHFLTQNRAEKILRLKMLWNKLLGRRLYSRYE